MENISDLIVEKRKERGLTQVELGAMLGISVKAVTDVQELTPELVHQFISKVVVHEPYRKDKRRHQELDIYYRGVGLVHIPDPDEMERLYQESMENNKQKQGKDSAATKAEKAEPVSHHKQNNEKTA